MRERPHPLVYVFLAFNTVVAFIWAFFLWRHVFTGRLSLSEVFMALFNTLVLVVIGWVWWAVLSGRLPSPKK